MLTRFSAYIIMDCKSSVNRKHRFVETRYQSQFLGCFFRQVFILNPGNDHPTVASSMNNLALLYQAQGRYGDAEPLYAEALGIARQRLGESHPNPQTIEASLINCLKEALDSGQANTLSGHSISQHIFAKATV